MIHFSEVITTFEKSAKKSIKIDITNSTDDNDLKLKKHSQLCDVIVLNEQCVNNETINFSSASLLSREKTSEKVHEKRLSEIIEQYKNEISKYSEQTPADQPIEHETN